jgi:hypothetical protein
MKLKNLPRNNIVLVLSLLALIVLFPFSESKDPPARSEGK